MFSNKSLYESSLQLQQDELIKKFNQPTRTDIIGYSIGKLLLTIFWAYLGYLLITFPTYRWTILDYANAIIHECGHYLIQFFQIFIFGNNPTIEFIAVAGGTGGQLLAPIFVTIYFIFKRAWYSAFFGIFWLGDNLIMNHFYVGDSKCMCYPAFGLGALDEGGGIHDWNYMLTKMGLLDQYQTIAKFEYYLGTIIILIGLTLMIGNILSNLLSLKSSSTKSPTARFSDNFK